MNEEDRATIRRQLPDLLQAVQLTPEFTSQLLRLRVIVHDFLDELETERRPLDRRRRLLLEVTRRGPNAFDGLVQALLESGQLQAARLLRPSLTYADLSPAALAAISAAVSRPQPTNPGEVHCVPTTPAHRPQPVAAPRPPDGPLPRATGRTDEPGPNLRLQPARGLHGTPSDTYRMLSKPRGLALVISNIHFNSDVHEEREGGEVDEVALPSLLRELNFEVQLERDLNHAELLDTIREFAKNKDHKMYDMAILAVLTHGGDRVLYGANSRVVLVEEVIRCFSHDNAPHLTGKPKWMIFQACRGSDVNRTVKVLDPNRQASDGQAVSAQAETHPKAEFGDIFLTYSSLPGYVSMRDLDYGTWLVQGLCKVFAESAHDNNLQELHTKLHDYMDKIETSDNQRQTIETSQRGWRRKLYFNPGL